MVTSVTFGHPNPQTTQNSTFCVAFHIFARICTLQSVMETTQQHTSGLCFTVTFGEPRGCLLGLDKPSCAP